MNDSALRISAPRAVLRYRMTPAKLKTTPNRAVLRIRLVPKA